MPIASVLTATAGWILKIGGGITLSRVLRKPIQKIDEFFFPFEKSSEKKRMDYQAQNHVSLENLSQEHRKELYNLQASISRNTEIAAKNFPLNLSPFVILGNCGFQIIDREKGGIEFSSNNAEELPLNIFVNPLLFPNNMQAGNIVMGQVWDVVIQKIESIFINEYGRTTERPVKFYSTAWNPNVRPGTHSAETIYYFLKYIPTIIVEPRYDGKAIHVIISGWGLGYNIGTMFRREINIDWDWNSMISTICYERSKSALALLSDSKLPAFEEKKKILQRNIDIYETLQIEEHISKKELYKLEPLGDYSRYFAVESADTQQLADAIACTIGLTMSAFSDLHYLVNKNIQPLFPAIADNYFNGIADAKFREAFLPLYTTCYQHLAKELPVIAPTILLEEIELSLNFGNRNKAEEKLKQAIEHFCDSKGIDHKDNDMHGLINSLLQVKFTSTDMVFLRKVRDLLKTLDIKKYRRELNLINDFVKIR